MSWVNLSWRDILPVPLITSFPRDIFTLVNFLQNMWILSIYVSSLALPHVNFPMCWIQFLVLVYKLENWTVSFQSHSLWQCGATKSTFHSQDYFSPGHPFHKHIPLIFLLNSQLSLRAEMTAWYIWVSNGSNFDPSGRLSACTRAE